MNILTRLLTCILVAFAALLASAPAMVQAAPGDVKATFDAPCRYPAGIASGGGFLYVADWREARIHEVRPADGKIVRTLDAPTLKPCGLAFVDRKLAVSDDHTGWIYFLDLETGMVVNSFRAPTSNALGLAYADGTLFVLTREKIYSVLPEDGTILGYFPVPAKSSRCMAHDGRYLWVVNRINDEIYMLDPETGKVLNILPAPGPHASGVAWHDHALWNVDFQTRKICKIAVAEEPMYRLTDIRRARVEYLWALNNYGPAEVTDLALNLAVPGELPNQTLLSEIEYSREPKRFARDRWGQECAIFDLGTVGAGSKAVVTYSVFAEVSAIRYLILPERTGSLDDIPREIREKYTADGSRYRLESPYIRETVRKVVGSEKNPYWIARKIYDFIIDRLEYEMIGGWDIPEVVLERGSGSCSEYTYSFIALCRAAGLPARYQGSLVVRGDDASVDEAFHRWAQIYLPGYGWVPVDANRGDKSSPADQGRGFGGLANRFLITTAGGGDSEYLGWSYNSFAKHRATGYCKIEEDNFGFWEPASAGAVQ